MLTSTLCLAAAGGAARDELPDPTAPPAGFGSIPLEVADDADRSLDLTAIFFADDRRLAIINDRRLKEGDSIGPARVLAISPNHVRLLRDGETIDLELVPHVEKLGDRSSRPAETRPDTRAAAAARPIDEGESNQ